MSKKLNPGQYAAIPRTDDYLRTMARALVPGLKGFLIRCTLRELEPTKGQYDFRQIVAALEFCKVNDRQLVVLLVDKTFSNERPLPLYLNKFELPNRSGGYTMARWLTEPVARLKALIRALGVRFDDHPNFEAVSLQESSLSLNDRALALHGYTPEGYRDALIEVIASANTSMPTTRMHWHMNFLPEKQAYIAAVAQSLVSGGHLLGGPDWLPDAPLLQRSVYPFYKQFKDQLTTFIDNQYDSYKHLHRKASATKYWTPPEMYDSAKAQIFVDYYFWTYLPKPHMADSYCYADAIPVIARDASGQQPPVAPLPLDDEPVGDDPDAPPAVNEDDEETEDET